MSKAYPYQARSLMRFQAQDGQFTLNTDQVVTVTGPTENAAEWLNVTDDQGASGTVPAGFLIPIEQREIRQETDPQPSLADPSASQPQPTSDDPVRSDHLPPASRSATSASTEQSLTTAPNISNPPQSSSHVSSNSQTPLESPPTAGPPPPAAKPSALRDRIAMFNKAGPAPASPPNNRPKPTIARKPMNFPTPAPPIEARASQGPLATPVASQEDDISRSTAQPGMSAADAEESVKASGSLKDRIRLLQQQQQQAAASSETSSTPPKPKREWKRPTPLSADESAVPIPLGLPPSTQHESVVEGEESSDHAVTEPVPNATEENSDTVTEEQAELERRRRIAERMAKLGGAKLGFGFPGAVPVKKPTISPKHSTETELLTEPLAEATVEESSSTLPPEKIVMPSIPKRAAPPRRKAPSPANVPAPSDATLVDNSQTSSNDQAQPSLEDSMLQASNNDELPMTPQHETSTTANDLANSDAPLEEAAEPTTSTDQAEPPDADLMTQKSNGDELPAPPRRKAPSPASISLPSDAPLEDAAQSPAPSNTQDSTPLDDPTNQAMNQDPREVPPAKSEITAPLDPKQDDNLSNPSSLKDEPIDGPVSDEPGLNEPREDLGNAAEEEEAEFARRQRIAERMAKLGGAKIGFSVPGGPALMAPKTVGLPEQQSTASDALATQQSPRESSTAADFPVSSPLERPANASRATPPTRKAPSPATILPVTDEYSAVEGEEQIDSPKNQIFSQIEEDSKSDSVRNDDAPPAPPSRAAPPIISHNPISSDCDSDSNSNKQ